MRWLERSRLALDAPDGGVALRRGALASLLAGTAAVAAAVWGRRPRAADGRGYREVARWEIPGGGEGRFIAVAPGTDSAALRALGEQLREEFRRTATAVVMVFDDAGAAYIAAGDLLREAHLSDARIAVTGLGKILVLEGLDLARIHAFDDRIEEALCQNV